MSYVPDYGDAGGDVDFGMLRATGVNELDANIEVPWERTTPTPVMADTKEGEILAYPHRNIPGSELKKETYTRATNWLYDQYANVNDNFTNLQHKMAAAGFMGKNPNYTQGTPDSLTQGAWDEILKIAVASDKTPQEIINEAIERDGGLEAASKKHNISGTGQAKADIRLTHPDDIKQMAREMSRKTLGKGWNEQQLSAFVASYQAQERAEGQAAQGSGATVTNAPSIGAAAEAQARRQNPTAAGATDWDNAAQMMMQAFRVLGGGGSE